jgi:plasmid maintenance system antidote protein VapI
MNVQIGEIIKEHVAQNGLTVTQFAKRINRTSQYVYDIYKQTHIHCELMQSISEALNVNLFAYYVQNVDSKYNDATMVSVEPEITIQIKLNKDTEAKILNKKVYDKIIEILK